jgi:hypothetical protein
MASYDTFSDDADTGFSLGTRELREARRKQELSLREVPHKPVTVQQGSDPYNTSGSFDRKKNWARVGKR